MLRRVETLSALGQPEIEAAVQSLETRTFRAGDVIYRQDDDGDDCFFVVAGECYATKQLHTFEEGTRVTHKRHGVGTVTKVTQDPSITRVDFDKGEYHRYGPSSTHKLKPVAAVEPLTVKGMECRAGDHFGEKSLKRIDPRPETFTCRTDVTLLRLTAARFKELKKQQDEKEDLLRGVSLFETFGDDQLAELASVLHLRHFADREALIRQGDEGNEFYILDAGECVATIQNGHCEQEVMRYRPGQLFGEKALLEHAPRAATVTAVGRVRVWTLSRTDVEDKLGSLTQLKAEQYVADPRHLIANFYRKGDGCGPAGALPQVTDGALPSLPHANGHGGASETTTSWFAVYRPCSRDSIAKMVGRVGTGKGLNIKGKSAKKNRLSGFVPFVQISKEEDKAALEASPRAARTRVFFQSAEARTAARAKLESALIEMQVEKGSKLQIDKQEVYDAEYEYEAGGAYGLNVPEALLIEVYITRPDLSPAVGWETGRDSEPAFLDMNRHSLRDGSTPPVVLYQFDRNDPMNPLGLLMAYAEARVTPVVSDFDTFLVGSRGMRYEPTPDDQVKLMSWALDHTAELLDKPNGKGWMSRWLQVLTEEARKGFHPHLPKFGYGDPTSYDLIGKIVDAVAVCGAVRHGAECFNFYFPQELDQEFLVVWDGLIDERNTGPPWKTYTEPDLRKFLIDRAGEGYSFPINPVWPVRDPGWIDVLRALQQEHEASLNLQSWFPPKFGVLERIEEMHDEYPDGFTTRQMPRRTSFWTSVAMPDHDSWDMANFASLEVQRETDARWARIKSAIKVHMLSTRQNSRRSSETELE